MMREAAFISKNLSKWRIFEKIIQSGRVAQEPGKAAAKKTAAPGTDREALGKKLDPDTLANMFVQLTDDLSYARTFYPTSKTTTYLNNMASVTHQQIYKTKKESLGRFVDFWKTEMPLTFRSVHREFLLAFIVFAVSVLIGVVSSLYDKEFPRLILGDGYVNMTLENIRSGDPMAVYKHTGRMDMFSQITLNNVMVSFRTFVSGFLTSIGTFFILFYNGVMVGAFQTLFYNEGAFLTSFLVIWIHGTLEIWAIIVAGAAGFVMGNSILFPGTYSRFQSFRMGAMRGLKVIIGTVPIFIVAGFLESFITRLTWMPDPFKAFIILASMSFNLFYFVFYPIWLSKRLHYNRESELGQGIS